MSIMLTSKGFYDSEVLEGFIQYIDDNNFKKEICFITTAINKADRDFHMTETERLLTEAGFTKVSFLDIEVEDSRVLNEYPVICLFGGHPYFLMSQIKQSKTDIILRELNCDGRFIIGHSSGAVVLGKTIRHAKLLHPEWDDLGLKEFDGIGLTNEIILPHSNRYSEQRELLEDFENQEGQRLIYIEDGKYIFL
ncbi:Type 1 glutamine amidotransferase-like domain-containing protein [Cohnella sp. GCM10027633]|uniref:Type 1 glutamine amidotransferase-like domain-containing protein n=1 Tax=unclassified Cohnella TaxID=2636738 RepID=UPI00363C954A